MFKHHIIFQNFVGRLRNMRQDHYTHTRTQTLVEQLKSFTI